MLEDKLLIWKFNRGDTRILGRIYEKYKNDLMTLATALLYNKTDAEDVIHDIFSGFVNSCGKLTVKGNLKGYLAACVANNIRNRTKSAQTYQQFELESIPDANQPELSVIFGEESQRLALALSKLPYEQRETVLLHLFMDIKFKAIASLQNVSANTAAGRYRYGLDKLRTLLNDEVKK